MSKRQLKVHPILARKLVTYVSEGVLSVPRHTQVYPGVFVHPQAEKSAIVVLGGAPIAEHAMRALRSCKHVDEYVVLQYPDRDPAINGPRSSFDEEGWALVVAEALSQTRDVNCVCSVFEVMVADNSLALANLASSSGMIAAHLPFELDPVDNGPFLRSLERELEITMEAA